MNHVAILKKDCKLLPKILPREDKFALKDINRSFEREGLEVYKDGGKKIHLRNIQNQTTSTRMVLNKRILTKEEVEEKKKLEKYLFNTSEDDIIEKVLIPIFKQLGFSRISFSGHKDKLLEYGKDLWMKYQLPTTHYIYFGIQIKGDKIGFSGKSSGNISEILNQITMMLDSPIWDPETNRKHLLDHIIHCFSGRYHKTSQKFFYRKIRHGG